MCRGISKCISNNINPFILPSIIICSQVIDVCYGVSVPLSSEAKRLLQAYYVGMRQLRAWGEGLHVRALSTLWVIFIFFLLADLNFRVILLATESSLYMLLKEYVTVLGRGFIWGPYIPCGLCYYFGEGFHLGTLKKNASRCYFWVYPMVSLYVKIYLYVQKCTFQEKQFLNIEVYLHTQAYHWLNPKVTSTRIF